MPEGNALVGAPESCRDVRKGDALEQAPQAAARLHTAEPQLFTRSRRGRCSQYGRVKTGKTGVLFGTVLPFSLRAYRHLASSLSGAYVPPPTTHAPGAKAA